MQIRRGPSVWHSSTLAGWEVLWPHTVTLNSSFCRTKRFTPRLQLTILKPSVRGTQPWATSDVVISSLIPEQALGGRSSCWLKMLVQSITKMYPPLSCPISNISWKFLWNLFRILGLILLTVRQINAGKNTTVVGGSKEMSLKLQVSNKVSSFSFYFWKLFKKKIESQA